ncbi:MAG: hypothetical protein Q9160_004112 [Pyrenula sp. 1 TL-2023]
MLTTIFLFLPLIFPLALSAPSQPVDKRSILPWSKTLRDFYWAVDRHIIEAKRDPDYPNNAPTCDLGNATLPNNGTPALPGPGTDGSFLKHVAIGRGRQNYTCDNATAAPKAIGAKAALFNASCIASAYPDILAMLPGLAINIPMPDPFSAQLASLPPSTIDLSGHHYFDSTGAPTFDLDVIPAYQFGFARSAKMNTSSAPAQPANTGLQGEPPVPWLYLNTINGTTGGIEHIYRVNTVGGSQPATCAGMPAAFEVEYAAEYWFYAKPS